LTEEYFTSGEPRLSVGRGANGNLEIRWVTADGFSLQSSTAIATDWSAVDASWIQVDAQQNASFSAPISGDAQFFRLIKAQ
jgi:hypothetical protein